MEQDYLLLRLFSLIFIAACLPVFHLNTLVVISTLLIPIYLVSSVPLSLWVKQLWQFKWLLASVLLFSLWFSPLGGSPLWQNQWVSTPSALALTYAGSKLMLLVSIVGLVKLCLYQLSATRLVQGFITMLMPLEKLGINTAVIANRAALVLNTAQNDSPVALPKPSNASGLKDKTSAIADYFAQLWLSIEAKDTPVTELNIQPVAGAVKNILIVLALIASLLLANHYLKTLTLS